MSEFRFPADVAGWLTETEGRGLHAIARGKRVLEIGSYCGRSTICLAQSAAHVTSVDPHDGTGTPNPRDTLDEFCGNVIRYEVSPKIQVHRGTLAAPDGLPEFTAGPFDIVFIDGAHDYPSVRKDIASALSRLAPDGLLAFHDYRTHAGEHDGGYDPGVTRAVNELLSAGAELIDRHGTVAVVRPRGRELLPAVGPSAIVALAMPHYGDVKFEAAEAFRCPTLPPDQTRVRAVARLDRPGSILTSNFNRAWATALNLRSQGVTHFAMLHADVGAPPGWLDTLFAEMDRLGADVVSAVVPLKTEHGLTSTAIGTESVYLNRRLSMREVFQLPETFGAADVEALTGMRGPLLVNTGLFLADLRKPWASECDDEGRLKWAFRFANEIRRDPKTGAFRAFVASEDWLLSHHLASVGARVYATRKVPCFHVGTHRYLSGKPWGEWDSDESYAEVVAELARAGEKVG